MTPKHPPDAPRLETREAWAVIRRDKMAKRSFIDLDTIGMTPADAGRLASEKNFKLPDWGHYNPKLRIVPVRIEELMVPEQVRE